MLEARLLPHADPLRRRHLAENSKSRVTADAAFLRTQTQSLSRNRVLSETDTINQARDANTARLRELRLQKEAADRAAAASAPPRPKRKQPV
ncbi:conserved hypothetical protein [Bosea sp. EC-HK365B]|nr:conserved hypothetical protein [Bosea sp. 7B]CAD5273574.1 conserved hypothetical protein [Bosea sp. 21B]CAD5284536.1 conserved hypothetical protein [Bosea sp. 46]VVT60190.1 conserved hypothetical protein [Bosea sp. EC-HK365B]VXC20707.1 conserved hypothetical protein [Bosea sp. 127]